MSIFQRIASIFVIAGTWLFACIHQILVWLVSVAQVVTQVRAQVTAVVLQDKSVVLTSHCAQKILASGASLDIYSWILSSESRSIRSGE